MGVNDLWKVLQQVEEKISLHNLAVGTGFIGNATGTRAFRVGIDASGWIYRALYRHGNTESPELVALFSRCSRLFQLPFIPVFVFDGPGRPKIKRGKQVRGTDHWLTRPFKQMLDGFGFQWITAPGEAEATLAAMTNTGIPVRVDAILTDDSDSFVFGASAILRIDPEDNQNYMASKYSAHDIETSLGLFREDFILIALLVGGDYGDGLDQCGIVTALALARAGLGRQLISGISGKSHAEASNFLSIWRETLRSELKSNASGYLPHKSFSIAARIPSSFPDLNIIHLYLQPIVSQAIPEMPGLSLRSPRLDILACFAEDHFSWGHKIGILGHFANYLFGGLVVRELSQRALVADGLCPPASSPSLIQRIVGERCSESTGRLAELRLILNVDPHFLTDALQALTGRRESVDAVALAAAVKTWILTHLPKVRVWVSKSMVEHVYPAIVLDYTCASNAVPRKRKHEADGLEVGSISERPAGRKTLAEGSSGKANSHRQNGKRYTAISVTFKGQETIELHTDSEGEL